MGKTFKQLKKQIKDLEKALDAKNDLFTPNAKFINTKQDLGLVSDDSRSSHQFFNDEDANNLGIIKKNDSRSSHQNSKNDPISYHVGSSNYSTKKIQPWHIWDNFLLNPYDADIIKRLLRTKNITGMTYEESRCLDYQKIIHISTKRISDFSSMIDRTDTTTLFEPYQIGSQSISFQDICIEYDLNSLDKQILELLLFNNNFSYVLPYRLKTYMQIIDLCNKSIENLTKGIK